MTKSEKQNKKSQQQAEALHFFRQTADQRHQMATGQNPQTVNVIEQRNACVKKICLNLKNVRNILDIGCGTGDLILDFAKSGINSTGIDFANEMIDFCNHQKQELSLDLANFHHVSVFDFAPADHSYDIISALGFIEYLNPKELTLFLDLTSRWLRPDGMLVLGSRNRLFNLFSLNRFTSLELEAGTTHTLLEEAVQIATCDAANLSFDKLATASSNLNTTQNHPFTGIDVSTRHQYAPGQLATILYKAGYTPKSIYPVNFHAFPPTIIPKTADLHVSIANAAFNELSDNFATIPLSSTFIMAACRNPN